MKRLYDFLLGRRRVVLAVGVLLALIGWRVGGSLPVDVFPEIREPRVVIQSEAGGLTAEEVERQVTMPIESAMNGLPGVRRVRASSGAGLSFVWVEFDWETPLETARFAVFERLAQVRESLPEGVEAGIAPVVSVTGEILMVALTAAPGGPTPGELRELAEFDLRTRLLRIAGIGEVVVTGGRLPELQILLDPERLAQAGVSPEALIEAGRGAGTQLGAGYLADVGGEEVPLRQVARVESVEALRQVVVPGAEARAVRLGDVAEVRVGGAPRRGSAAYQGEEAVVLSVQKAPGGNTLALTAAVEAELAAFAAANPGVQVHPQAYRQADFIELSIAEGRSIVRDAVLIVVVVLGVTLLRVRTILLTLLSMPLSVLLGFCLFPAFGLGINMMTLGGLAVAIGDIVDCTIIFVEVIWRRLEENAALPPDERETWVAAIGGAAREVLPSVLFSTLMIVLVFLPLLMLSGLESRFFAPLGLAYLLVFGASFVVAVVLVPVLCGLFWREPRRPVAAAAGPGPVVRAVLALYRPLLRGCLRVPWLVCGVMAGLLAVTIWVASSFGTSFLQNFQEDTLTVLISAPPSTSLAESERLADRAADFIRDIPGVTSVLRRTGRAERDQHAEPVSTSELVVRVDLAADAAAVRGAIREGLATVPGVSVLVGYPIAHRIGAVLSGTSAELAILLFGEDPERLRTLAQEIKALMAEVPEVADVNANREVLVETLRIDYDLEALGEMGLTLRSAGEQLSAAFRGVEVGEVRQGLRRRAIVVRHLATASEEGPTPQTLRDFPLVGANGVQRRLADVAQVYAERAPNLLIREQTRRVAQITCNAAEGVDAGRLVEALRQRLEPAVHAAGCSLAFSGAYEARQSAARRLTWVGAGLLTVIFLLLTAILKEVRLALLALLNVPLSLLGSVVAVAVTTPVLSVASLIGFVTVVGFVLRNGLLLLSRYRELEAQGVPLQEALVRGSCERLVPVLMTSLTTVLGLIPLVAAAHRPGGELLAPLAIVQFGGLISATLLSLLVLPTAYWLCRRPWRPASLAVLGAVVALLLPGCQSYEAAPIDWAAEAAAWQPPEAAPVMTLAEAQALALRANPTMNRARLAVAHSEAAIRVAGLWQDPTLSADLSRTLASVAEPYLMGTALSFTLPLSGTPAAEARAAEAYAAGDRAELVAQEHALRRAVAEAAVRWAAAERRLTAREAAESDLVKRAEAQLARLAAAGEAPRQAWVAAEQRRQARTLALKQARAAVAQARSDFAALLGLPPEAAERLPLPADAWRDLPAALPPWQPPLAWVAHPRVQAALARLAATEAELEVEIRRQYPDLEIGPTFEREEGENRLGFGFSLPLPLWNRNRAAIASATAQRDLTRADAVAVWREVVQGAAAAYAQLQQRWPHQCPPCLPDDAALYLAGEVDEADYLEACEAALEATLREVDEHEEGQLLQLMVEQLP